jgi:F-type H+-transporting ATPase subunit delta
MAELATIARPYAEALFAAAQASSAASAWLPLIDQLAAVAHDPQVAQVVADPKLEPPQVVGLLGGIAGGRAGAKLPADLANFLALLVENGRLGALPAIAVQFRSLKNAAAGVADCLIETAFPLSDTQVAALVAALASRFPLHLDPTVRVEPSLIGGVRVTVGDQVLDSSVRARLDQMRTALAA